MNQPLIGILPLYDDERERYWMLPDYMKKIQQAGGLPMMLPLTDDSELIRTLAQTFDGFLFPGGHDITPSIYNEIETDLCGPTCVLRDVMENRLFSLAAALDKPVLGIGRGLQMLNVFLGGTLYQDLDTEFSIELPHCQPPSCTELPHPVTIEKNSLFYDVFGEESFCVNSCHHQGIRTLAPDLKIGAKTADGLIEGAYIAGKKFIAGVQWHPESAGRTNPQTKRLFQVFISKCRKQG